MESITRTGNKKYIFYLSLLLFLACFFRYSAGRAFFFDEYSTWKIAQSSTLSSLFEKVRTIELKPPLHFLYAALVVRLLKLPGTSLDHSAMLLRMSSLPFILLTWYLMYRASGTLFDSPMLRHAWLIAFFFNETIFTWSGFFRLYSMFILASFCSLLAGYHYLLDPAFRHRVLWVACVSFSLYTHVFAFIPLAAQISIFLMISLVNKDRARFRRLLLDCVLICAAFSLQIPGLVYLLGHPAQGMDWNPAFGWSRLLGLFVFFHSSRPTLFCVLCILLIFIPLFALCVTRSLGQPSSCRGYFSWYFLLGLLFACILGLIFPHSFEKRYVIFLFAPYLALVLSGISCLPRAARTFTVAILLAVTLMSTVGTLLRLKDWSFEFSHAVDKLMASTPTNSKIVCLLPPKDYVIAADFLKLDSVPMLVYFSPGDIPFWTGGRYIDGKVVIHDLSDCLSFENVCFLGRKVGRAKALDFFCLKGFTHRRTCPLDRNRALLVFHRDPGGTGR